MVTEAGTVQGNQVETQSPMLDQVPEVEQEKPAKGKVPKVEAPKAEEVVAEDIVVGTPTDQSELELVDDSHRMLHPQAALAFVMTQPDPVEAMHRLRREQRLTDVTSAYLLLEENGYKLS